jgi:hypothetical protein
MLARKVAVSMISRPAADQAAVAEQLLDLLGRGVGGHVEILGLEPGQQVAYGAAHQAGAVAGLVQPVQHAHGIGRDAPTRDRVLVARDDPQRRRNGGVVGRHSAWQFLDGLLF